MLCSSFSTATTSAGSGLVDPDSYHPALRPLYAHFAATLESICWPFVHDVHELAYIAASCWPGFVKPVLDEHRRRLDDYRARRTGEYSAHDEDEVPDSEEEPALESEEPDLRPPTEETRMRLTRLFTPAFTAALEALYPRLTNATAWARTHAPPDGIFSLPPAQASAALPPLNIPGEDPGETLQDLPRLAKFVLVAAFLASTNPPKTDMRMFGRGRDERAKRRRRKGGSPRKPKPGAVSGALKIPQRLLGPMTFTLDRLLAILGNLLEENDAETRPPAPEYTAPGEYTDVEISRVALYTQIMQLASMRLLLRASPNDKLDLALPFKCGIGYDAAQRLAREVGIMLHDLLWDPV